MISRLPLGLQTVARNYFENQQLPSEARPLSAQESLEHVDKWDSAIGLWQKKDNGPEDLDPRRGVFDAGHYEAEFSQSGNEFLFKTKLGAEQPNLHTYGQREGAGFSLYEGLLNPSGEAAAEWVLRADPAVGGFLADTLQIP